MKLKKIKEVLQKMELKKFFKYSVLSILIIYFVLNISNLILSLYDYNYMKSKINIGCYETRPELEQLLADNKSFEEEYLLTYYEGINMSKNDFIEISENQKEIENQFGYNYDYGYESLVEPSNEKFRQMLRETTDRSDLDIYYSINYTEAMNSIHNNLYLLGTQVDILVYSIYIGLSIGLLLYMYSKFKNSIKLFVGYILFVLLLLVINNYLYFPSFEISLFSHYFTNDSFWIDDSSMFIVVSLAILLITIKVIKNKLTIQKLNKMVKANKNEKIETDIK